MVDQLFIEAEIFASFLKALVHVITFRCHASFLFLGVAFYLVMSDSCLNLLISFKDQEKIKRKKMLTPKTEDSFQIETDVIAQPQYTRERLGSDSGSHSLATASKPISNTTAASMRTPSPSTNGDRLKQDKLKGSSSNSMDEAKMVADSVMTKKKVKRKPEQDLDGTPLHPEKLPAQPNDERHKSQKLSAGLPQKSNLQSTAPNFEQSS